MGSDFGVCYQLSSVFSVTTTLVVVVVYWVGENGFHMLSQVEFVQVIPSCVLSMYRTTSDPETSNCPTL